VALIQHAVNEAYMINPVMIQDQIALEKLQKFLQTNRLPHEDIAKAVTTKGRVFLGYYDDTGELVGSGGLELYGDSALLRSVAVKENARGQELGKKIVDDLVIQARSSKINNIFLLTETAKDFFTKKGFTIVSRDEVPSPVRASSEFTHVCPSSATCMFYKL
jgi:amino-acid N-acetyltransferase